MQTSIHQGTERSSFNIHRILQIPCEDISADTSFGSYKHCYSTHTIPKQQSAPLGRPGSVSVSGILIGRLPAEVQRLHLLNKTVSQQGRDLLGWKIGLLQ